MCVLIVKPKGVKMPDAETLRMAYKANPHGCGFASKSKFFKSLSFASFMRNIAKVSDEEACIIHFRFGTHGSIKRDNCHPFQRGGVCFAHNGIIDMDTHNDMTDSETAFNDAVYPALEKYGWNSENANAVVDNLCRFGSKIALMRDGEILMFGNFIHASDGCFYSNNRFRYYH